MSAAEDTTTDGTRDLLLNRGQRWWLQPDEDAYSTVFAVVANLAQDRSHPNELRVWRDLYIDASSTSSLGDLGLFRDRMMRTNVVANCVDSIHARLTKVPPKPWIVTEGGNHQLQSSAKRVTQWGEGQFEKLDAYKLGSDMWRDAEVFGEGHLKVFERDGAPAIEPVWTGDIYRDPLEERHKIERTRYQVAAIDREVLMEAFPDCAADIALASKFEDAIRDGVDAQMASQADLVLVVEAWRLPDSKDRPGKHVIAVSNCTLHAEPWTRPRFPFVDAKWKEDPLSLRGVGLVQQLAGIQSELNRLTATISDAMRLMVPMCLVPVDSNFAVERVTNDVFAFYTYEGNIPPTFTSPQPINPEFLQREQELVARAYETVGVSQMGATSKKPAGLDSGAAIRTYQDIESERFVTQNQAYNRIYVDLLRELITVADDIADREPELAANSLKVWGGEKSLEAISYVQERLKDDPYEIRIFPVSSLPSTPAGKIAMVGEMLQNGMIDPVVARKLIGFPDLEAQNRLDEGARELADKLVDQCMRGKQAVGSPYMDLDYARKRACQQRALAEIDDVPSNVLDCLSRFIGHTNALIKQREAGELIEFGVPPTNPQPPGGPQGGLPMPPGVPGQPVLPGPETAPSTPPQAA